MIPAPRPARHVGHPGADGPLVGEDLVLPLVITAQNDDHTVAIARLDYAPAAVEIRLAQRAIGR